MAASRIASNPAQFGGQRGGRHGVGKFGPQFFGGQTQFQRLAMHGGHFTSRLFQGRLPRFELFAPQRQRLLPLLPLPFQLALTIRQCTAGGV